MGAWGGGGCEARRWDDDAAAKQLRSTGKRQCRGPLGRVVASARTPLQHENTLSARCRREKARRRERRLSTEPLLLLLSSLLLFVVVCCCLLPPPPPPRARSLSSPSSHHERPLPLLVGACSSRLDRRPPLRQQHRLRPRSRAHAEARAQPGHRGWRWHPDLRRVRRVLRPQRQP